MITDNAPVRDEKYGLSLRCLVAVRMTRRQSRIKQKWRRVHCRLFFLFSLQGSEVILQEEFASPPHLSACREAASSCKTARLPCIKNKLR